MLIYNDINKRCAPCCVALGFFDGVHLGHRKLLSNMTSYAKANGLESCVFTFTSSPAAALGFGESRALMTCEDKLNCIAAMGVDSCYAVDFLDCKDIAAETFVRSLLIEGLNAHAVFCGFNYTFGKNAAGDSDMLRKICGDCGVEVFVTEPVCVGGETVSSTRLRELVERGKMFEANAMLAQPFSVSGVINHGKQNGRTVGIPTLNQALPPEFVVPRRGVYASFAIVGGKRYKAISNLGVRPTVSGESINLETHILENIDAEMYGREVRTQLLWFERDERKFGDLGELAEQIHRDIDHICKMNIYDKSLSTT